MNEATPSLSKLRVGDLIDERYRVEKHLGSGGMGTVYLATQVELGRMVVVKTLRPKELSSRRRVTLERFRREAQLLAVLDHPGIVRVFDFRADSFEHAYLVMEHLPGGSVLDRVAEQLMTEDEAVDLIIPVLDALDAAHRRELIHRDLKAGNLLYGAADEVKIIDFGLARFLDQERSARLTKTGQILGTPGYLAREQALGEEVDHRADLYSVGVLGYRTVTGRYPFPVHSRSQLLVAALAQRPWSLVEIDPSFDEGLSDILLKAVQPEREDRWASAAEMKAALEDWRRARPFRSAVRRTVPDQPEHWIASGPKSEVGSMSATVPRRGVLPFGSGAGTGARTTPLARRDIPPVTAVAHVPAEQLASIDHAHLGKLSVSLLVLAVALPAILVGGAAVAIATAHAF